MHDATLVLQRAAARLRRRALTAAYLGTLARHAAAALLVAGAAALLLRFLGEMERERAALVLGVAALAPLTAFFAARRRFLTAGGAGAWLDVRAGGSGLVVTGLETGDPRWAERAEALLDGGARPHVRTERMLAPVLPAALFVAAALWVDVPVEPPGPPVSLYEAALDRLEEKLNTLEEEVELDDERAEELEQRLSDLREEVESGVSPEAAFEALDRLEEQLEELASKAAEEAQSAAESLEAARAEASAEQPDLGDMTEALAEAMETMAEAGLGGDLSESLSETLAGLGLPGLELPEGAQLEAGEGLELSEELLEMLREMMEGLEGAGLLQPGVLRPLTQADLERLRLSQHECDEECEGGT